MKKLYFLIASIGICLSHSLACAGADHISANYAENSVHRYITTIGTSKAPNADTTVKSVVEVITPPVASTLYAGLAAKAVPFTYKISGLAPGRLIIIGPQDPINGFSFLRWFVIDSLADPNSRISYPPGPPFYAYREAGADGTITATNYVLLNPQNKTLGTYTGSIVMFDAITRQTIGSIDIPASQVVKAYTLDGPAPLTTTAGLASVVQTVKVSFPDEFKSTNIYYSVSAPDGFEITDGYGSHLFPYGQGDISFPLRMKAGVPAALADSIYFSFGDTSYGQKTTIAIPVTGTITDPPFAATIDSMVNIKDDAGSISLPFTINGTNTNDYRYLQLTGATAQTYSVTAGTHALPGFSPVTDQAMPTDSYTHLPLAGGDVNILLPASPLRRGTFDFNITFHNSFSGRNTVYPLTVNITGDPIVSIVGTVSSDLITLVGLPSVTLMQYTFHFADGHQNSPVTFIAPPGYELSQYGANYVDTLNAWSNFNGLIVRLKSGQSPGTVSGSFKVLIDGDTQSFPLPNGTILAKPAISNFYFGNGGGPQYSFSADIAPHFTGHYTITPGARAMPGFAPLTDTLYVSSGGKGPPTPIEFAANFTGLFTIPNGVPPGDYDFDIAIQSTNYGPILPVQHITASVSGLINIVAPAAITTVYGPASAPQQFNFDRYSPQRALSISVSESFEISGDPNGVYVQSYTAGRTYPIGGPPYYVRIKAGTPPGTYTGSITVNTSGINTIAIPACTVVQPAKAPASQAYHITFANTATTGTTVNWTNGNGAARAVFIAQTAYGVGSPANAITYTANNTFGSGTQIGSSGWYCIYNGTGSSVNVSGLSPQQIYRVTVVEYNGNAGVEGYLTTGQSGSNVTTLGSATVAPVNPAYHLAFANTTTSATTLSWTNGSGTARAVFVTQGQYGTPVPVGNTHYTANATFGSGTQVGASGWYCVYNGTGSSATVSGLSASTIYRYCVVEYNGTSSAEQYGLTGLAPANNSTAASPTAAPVLSSYHLTFTNISQTGATISWTNGSGANRAVFIASTGYGYTVLSDNTTYIASTIYGAGSQAGTSGWYCVYNGSGSGVSISGLSPTALYRVTVIDYNGSTGTEKYNLTGLAPSSFVTAGAGGSGVITMINNGLTTGSFDTSLSIEPANILTPNGDGRNDTWIVKNIEAYLNNEVTVYTKDGKQVFREKGYHNEWSGNGSLARGTYYYTINLGDGKIIHGYITVL